MKLNYQLTHPTEKPVKELFFLISPPRHIASDVFVLKDDVHYLTGRELNDRYSRAHISLFKYSDTEHHMKHMIRFVEARATEIKPFNIFLKDFGTFYNGSNRTIYMDIVNKTPIQEIFEKTVKEDKNFIPHITIAKNLLHEDFLKCWPYLKGLNYSNQHFLCDRITVLAKADKSWIHFKDIMFGGNA
ncbi:2'-5' RNA ligase family protein [Chryseosolibacter indicus]|uniref:2'-5' RNA ligase family protein n=1 Tax=Chryseosolibacter indicus TaxID=2782351 RepID=A0ABS5VPA6_9BACT|nr:2'-5' RNA ligase family protein [Chryseosolibacter indicus]MBT1703248.1 2'-5' RNA ligase family protein [Chryseosolibacter indicus]